MCSYVRPQANESPCPRECEGRPSQAGTALAGRNQHILGTPCLVTALPCPCVRFHAAGGKRRYAGPARLAYKSGRYSTLLGSCESMAFPLRVADVANLTRGEIRPVEGARSVLDLLKLMRPKPISVAGAFT